MQVTFTNVIIKVSEIYNIFPLYGLSFFVYLGEIINNT